MKGQSRRAGVTVGWVVQVRVRRDGTLTGETREKTSLKKNHKVCLKTCGCQHIYKSITNVMANKDNYYGIFMKTNFPQN